ncbi:MAG: RNA polymerase sigma factor [Planctomycetota bacterium]|nr:RNA polymerase sigma factor [Planctomycetota bacterium]
MSPSTLWTAWVRDRDEAAFETLVRPELPASYNLARRMGLADADAQDVVQEALGELAQTRSQRPAQVGVGAWLMRAVRLRALMSRRSERRRKRREATHGRPLRKATATGAAVDVEEEVEHALSLLGEDDRQILVLRFLYDLEYREIAYVLGVSENACRIRVHRASERLRARLGNKAPTLLAAIPLIGLPNAAPAIAAATQGAAGAALGSTFLGAVIVNTGMKMAASAAAAALLTAGAFVAFQKEAAPPITEPPTEVGAVPAEGETPSMEGGAAPMRVDDPIAPSLEGRKPLGGTGVIEGRVTTRDGAPIADVVLVGTPQITHAHTSGAGDPPPVADVEEEMRKAAAAAHLRVTGTRRTTTGADGRYRLTGIADTPYRIAPYRKGYRFNAVRGHDAWRARDGQTVDFNGTAIASVKVQIKGIDRADAGQVGLLRARDRESLKRAGMSRWRADRPHFQLEPGTWWVQAVQGRNRERASEPRQITVVSGQEPPALTLTLKGQPGLRGRVTFAGGLHSSRIEIHGLPLGDAEVPDTWHPRTSQGVLRANYDRRDGTFTFRDIAPGRYLVGATIDHSAALGLGAVVVEEDTVDHEIRIEITDLRPYAVLHVLGADGKPVPERLLDISASYKGPGMGFAGGGHNLRRSDDAWLVAQSSQVPMPWSEGAPKGDTEYKLRVIHRKLGTKYVTYDPASGEELTVSFADPASLSVTLENLEGGPLDGKVSLRLVDSLPTEHMSLEGLLALQADNVFTFTNAQPGSQRLILIASPEKASAFRGEWVIVDVRPVDLRAGDNTLTWRIPDLHSLELHPPTGEERVRFGLVRKHRDGDWMQQFASSKEKHAPAVFRYLPAGSYELVGSVNRKPRRIPVQVPGDKVVRLD